MVLTFNSGDVLEHPPLNNMVRVLNGDGVLSGFAVTQRGAGANMSVDVALGKARIVDVVEAETGTTNVVVVAAHATLERKDLITYDATANTPAVIKGTDHAGTEADPTYPPDMPAGDILLAIVMVGAATTTIVDGDITDCRIVLPDPDTFVFPSDTLQASDDSIEALGPSNYAKIKEIVIPAHVVYGKLRISFAINETSSGTAYGKIYNSGVAVGSARSEEFPAYTTYTEDIDDWKGGDTVELWGYYSAGGAGNVKEFRVYCDHVLIVQDGDW